MIVKFCKASAMALITMLYFPTLWAATPQLEIIADRTELRSFDKTNVTFAFSEEPQGFDIYDIGVTNDFLSNLVPGGSSNNWVYIAEFTKGAMGTDEDIENSTNGSVSQITVADGTYTNTSGDPGTGATEDIAYNPALDGDGLVGEAECPLTRYTRTAADAVTVVGNDGNDFSMSTSGNITYPTRVPDTNRDNIAILLLNAQQGTITMDQFDSPIVNPVFWLSGLDYSGMDFTGLVDKDGSPVVGGDIIILKDTEKPGNDPLTLNGLRIQDSNPDNDALAGNVGSTNGGFVIRGEFTSISYLSEDLALARANNDFYVIDTNHVCDTDGDGIANINDADNNIINNILPTTIDDTSLNNIPGSAVTVNVLDNDRDPDGLLVPATVQIAGTSNSGDPLVVAAEGAWSITPGSGAITFTPAAGFTGDPTAISYTVEDNAGDISNEATVTVGYTNIQLCDASGFKASGSRGFTLNMFDGSVSQFIRAPGNTTSAMGYGLSHGLFYFLNNSNNDTLTSMDGQGNTTVINLVGTTPSVPAGVILAVSFDGIIYAPAAEDRQTLKVLQLDAAGTTATFQRTIVLQVKAGLDISVHLLTGNIYSADRNEVREYSAVNGALLSTFATPQNLPFGSQFFDGHGRLYAWSNDPDPVDGDFHVYRYTFSGSGTTGGAVATVEDLGGTGGINGRGDGASCPAWR